VWLAAVVSATGYVFRHYTVDDGLPYNGVRAICQDCHGFMWFGLDNGLCRYDGVRMQTYRHNGTSVDQFVASLCPQDTCLWIGTSHGLTRMRFSDERFFPFTMKTSTGVAITGSVLSITTDARGRLWVSVEGQGVFRYDSGSRQLRLYATRQIGCDIIQLVAGPGDELWAVPRQGRAVLYRLDAREAAFKPFAPSCPYSLNYEVTTMAVDSRAVKWLGTRSHGLISLAADGSMRGWLLSGGDAVKNIHSILEVQPGRILVGSDDGLALLDTATGRVEKYTAQSGQAGTLSDRFVYPLVRDREGGIWIGTFYGGLNYVSPSSGQFQSYVHTTSPGSIGGNIINHFAEDKLGNIWIASDDGGLARLEPRSGTITRYALSADNPATNNVHGLWADADCLWVGTYTGGILRMSLDGQVLRVYQAYDSPLPLSDARSGYSLHRDSRGTLWCGSLESVSRYDGTQDRFVFVKRLGALVLDIDEDSQGNLWFATQGKGLFMLDGKGRWQHFQAQDKAGRLPDNNVNCVLVNSHKQILIATQAGICQFEPATRQFRSLDIDLHGLEASAIVEDGGSYWITTVGGMVHYVPGKQPRWFNKNDGLQNNQFFPNAMLRGRDGRIYVGTNFGFNSFKPSQIAMNKIAPVAVITGLQLMGKPVATGSKTLPQAITYTRRIDLSHKQNVITLSYASLSYCTPENNKYAYRLEGFDHDWNYVGSATQATYTNLSPGKYTFRVKATNNDGVWSKSDAVLQIVVHPPFYWSLPMKILYLLLAVLLAFYTVRMLLLRSERRHQAETERLKAEKEREVRDAKIGFFTMVAHEIRTPVSLIIGPLENIMGRSKTMSREDSDDLDIIDRNAHRLLYLVNQLLDFRKVEQKTLVSHFSLCNIAQIVSTVSERFVPTFEQKGIAFSTVTTDEQLSAVVDSEAVTKIVSNLLTNAVKYARTQATLRCEPSGDGQAFRITVSDDGQGVKPEDSERIFKPFYQSVDNRPGTGIGLSIVKSIVDRHHGTVGVESTPGHGATFVVTMPLSQPGVEVGRENALEGDVTPDKDTATDALSTPDAPANESAPDGHRLTLLVVEDNADLLNFISNNLRKAHNVLTATDGMEALGVLAKTDGVSLIVSDWMMPRMGGDELCRRVRADQRTSHLPFILLTAKTDTVSKIDGLRCGADSYIEKPFSMHYLEERIKNLIGMREMLQRKFSGQPLEPIKSIAPTAIDSDFLTRMQQVIEDNFSNSELSVSFLADQLSISRSSLFSKIKSLSGMTPGDMIMLVRLKKAAQLLRGKKYQVNEVCYMVGFSNPSYFSKCFKRQFDVTPAEFASKDGGETAG